MPGTRQKLCLVFWAFRSRSKQCVVVIALSSPGNSAGSDLYQQVEGGQKLWQLRKIDERV